ncbi:hypothetical protein GO013_15730 [Pseudodesulfovibrio sp. JC047]|uniref:hypothetical protein n=1 Tax=Pseudodesulfovibrio sp. JC047 TaxID=2683199 RepID=UPI0013D4B4A4|nr:hypothetical protein [Pseudodesulfovibrio sp. JC047]NDV20861.1 hypothetical protein [Pseudodesulfovibrio sp. JC047]
MKLAWIALAVLLVGCSSQREMADCKKLVFDFEKKILAQDTTMNTAYAPFQRACANLSASNIPVTAKAAIKAAEQCNYAIYQIDIPNNIPKELNDILVQTRNSAAASCFARGKIAGNILYQLTREGKRYSTVEKLRAEYMNFHVQAGVGLNLAKEMVGLTELSSEQENGNDPVFTLTLPSDTPKETIKLVRNSVPAFEKYLPGLFKYQDSMTFRGVDSHYPYWSAPDSGLPEDTSVTWLKFVVADDGGTIPSEYRAWGHHIKIGIVESGEALVLQKAQAKSVFLDRPFPASGEDLVMQIQ